MRGDHTIKEESPFSPSRVKYGTLSSCNETCCLIKVIIFKSFDNENVEDRRHLDIHQVCINIQDLMILTSFFLECAGLLTPLHLSSYLSSECYSLNLCRVEDSHKAGRFLSGFGAGEIIFCSWLTFLP